MSINNESKKINTRKVEIMVSKGSRDEFKKLLPRKVEITTNIGDRKKKSNLSFFKHLIAKFEISFPVIAIKKLDKFSSHCNKKLIRYNYSCFN